MSLSVEEAMRFLSPKHDTLADIVKTFRGLARKHHPLLPEDVGLLLVMNKAVEILASLDEGEFLAAVKRGLH